MKKLLLAVLFLTVLSILLGVLHGYQTIPNIDRQDTVVPAFEPTKTSEWKKRIEAFAQFAPKEEVQNSPSSEQIQNELLGKSTIQSAKLVGIFIDQDASAIIMSGKAPEAEAKRYRVGESFDEQWRLEAILATSITWRNESNDEQFSMHLFDPSKPKN